MSLTTYEIRSKIVKDKNSGELLQPNNSLVFSWKPMLELLATPQWYVVSIPEGVYTMEELDKEFQYRINDIMGRNSSTSVISILPSTIMIESPYIVIDIYQSSLRTVLGWPETPPSEHHPQILTYNNSIYGNGIHFFHKNITSMEILYAGNY